MNRSQVSMQAAHDVYERDVQRVVRYLTPRLMRGDRLERLIYDTASEFPGIKLSAFNDALAEINSRAGTVGFPDWRVVRW
jgi:hypothetical protein